MALKYVFSSTYLILFTKANRRFTHCRIPIVAIRERNYRLTRTITLAHINSAGRCFLTEISSQKR